jgi:4-hydroxy-3-methylbut-2-enyl diphosphate reductase
VKKGRVSNIKTYGAFVDIGGVEGLLHVSEMSWQKIKHPGEKVAVGQEIDVFVLGVDREKGKVALGLKQLEPDPWVQAAELYKAGQIVEGKIVRLVRFGAFAELGNGIEGLIHISELSWDPIGRPEDVVKPGDQVTLKVLRVLPDEQKIGLSMKAVKPKIEASAGTSESGEAKTTVTLGDMLKSKSENPGESPSP